MKLNITNYQKGDFKMQDLFMALLLFLVNHGKLTEADLYKSGRWATLVVETKDGKFKISISKEDEVKGNE